MKKYLLILLIICPTLHAQSLWTSISTELFWGEYTEGIGIISPVRPTFSWTFEVGSDVSEKISLSTSFYYMKATYFSSFGSIYDYKEK